MKNFFKTKTRWYFVKKNEDGSLWITCDGLTGIENAGQFIISLGGIDKILERCTEEISLEEFIARRNESVEKRKNHRLMSLQMNAEKERKEEAEIREKFAALRGAAINPTLDNIEIVLKYILATGERPAMTVGYSADIYDCDGKLAVGMKLDAPIEVAGEQVEKIGYKIPRGHLTKYQNIDALKCLQEEADEKTKPTIKTYRSNMEITLTNGQHITLYSDNYFNADRINESEERESLREMYNLTEVEVNEIISELLMQEWIDSDEK